MTYTSYLHFRWRDQDSEAAMILSTSMTRRQSKIPLPQLVEQHILYRNMDKPSTPGQQTQAARCPWYPPSHMNTRKYPQTHQAASIEGTQRIQGRRYFYAASWRIWKERLNLIAINWFMHFHLSENPGTNWTKLYVQRSSFYIFAEDLLMFNTLF